MGRLFPALLFFTLLLTAPLLEAGNIYLPQNPTMKAPPKTPAEEIDRDLYRKRQNRKKREPKKPPLLESATEERDRSLQQEAAQPRSLRLAFQVNLVLPFISTSGNREHYTADLTSHFHVFYRNTAKAEPNKYQLYWGFRIAPFSGSGIHEGIPGRYGLTYFGPSVGIGNFFSLNLRNNRSSIRGGSHSFPKKKIWFAMAGIAVRNQLGSTEHAGIDESNDFKTKKGSQLEASGFWFELSHHTIHFGALGVSYSFGIQTAHEKNFAWISIGSSAWN